MRAKFHVSKRDDRGQPNPSVFSTAQAAQFLTIMETLISLASFILMDDENDFS
jgi:hypothetical protein